MLWLAQKSQEKKMNVLLSWIFFKIHRQLKFWKSIVADNDKNMRISFI